MSFEGGLMGDPFHAVVVRVHERLTRMQPTTDLRHESRRHPPTHEPHVAEMGSGEPSAGELGTRDDRRIVAAERRAALDAGRWDVLASVAGGRLPSQHVQDLADDADPVADDSMLTGRAS